VAYVASPVDLLPEAVLPVVGAADDAVVLSWAIKAFVEETDRFLAWEAGQGRPRQTSPHGGQDADQGRTRTPSEASRVTVPGATVPDAAVPGGTDSRSGGRRRDRDSTGAASPGGLVGRVAREGTRQGERSRLPEGVRQAATDYVLESVRKRLER
jgi:hypothetical protein